MQARRRRLAERIRSQGFIPAQELIEDVPTHFGRYEVLRPVGKGASSEVYLVRDAKVGRDVALKILLGLDTDLTRFEREMDVLAGLKHPGIVPIYDAGQQGGRAYYVMEYLGERTLADALGTLSLEEGLQIVQEVALACHAAHERGVVHRDLKPDNVLLADRPVVVDFGVAKLLDDYEGRKGKTTRAGSAVGTPAYMAPEQVLGEAVDRRVDVYALGVMLYELVAGMRPFTGVNFTDLSVRICDEPPQPPRELNPTLSPALERLILRALAKNPDQRFPTSHALARAIGDLLDPPARAPTSTWKIAMGCALLALVLGFSLGRATAPAASAPSPNPSVAKALDPESGLVELRRRLLAWEAGSREPGKLVPEQEPLALLAELDQRVAASVAAERPAVLTLRARVRHDLGRGDDALRDLNEVFEGKEPSAEAALERAWLRWARLQEGTLRFRPQAAQDLRLREVVSDLRRALAGTLPKPRRELAEVLLALAQAWRAPQREQIAVRLAHSAKGSFRLTLLHAQLLVHQKQRTPAIQALEHAGRSRFLTAQVCVSLVKALLYGGWDWKRATLASRAALAAHVAQPHSPDVARALTSVFGVWLLNWHAQGGPQMKILPKTAATVRGVRDSLGKSPRVQARAARLLVRLFESVGGGVDAERVAREAAALADSTRGDEHGIDPWLALALFEMHGCARKVSGAPARLQEVLLRARRWYPAASELATFEKVASRYGVAPRKGPR
jgi:hypothetical protein